MTNGPTRVEVALPLPIAHTFTYLAEDPTAPAIGTRVLVPFRREERIGWVVGPGSTDPLPGLRPLLATLDERPTLQPDLLELCRWMARYYVTPLGIAIRAVLPAVLSDVSRDFLALQGPAPEDLRPRERRLVEVLSQGSGPLAVRTLRKALGKGSVWPEVRSLASRGIVSHTTVPPAEPPVKTRRVVRRARVIGTLAERDELFARSGRQREAYALIEAAGGALDLSHLLGEGGFSRGVIRGLEEKGLVTLADEEELRDPFAGSDPPAHVDHPLNEHQEGALGALVEALDAPGPPFPFLLHGITGSGKTLVYVRLLEAVLARGRSAIVLVPEIALTPQTVSRFRARFPDQIAVLHSGLSDGERYDAWRQLRSGAKRIAIGARSALFAPLEDLGAVVVDEEHDGSYKQSEAPRYHARDLAVIRARAHGAVCVLGSATPSLESWHNQASGKYRLLTLPERAGEGRLPLVRVVDLRGARKTQGGDRGRTQGGAEAGPPRPWGGVLSEELVTAVHDRMVRREQVILLLNRRGYSSFIQCRECGEVEECEHCSVSLTYHRTTHRLLCHHCRFEAAAPTRCRRCGSGDLSHRGIGTEQVERITSEAFPEARIARMDVDTTSGKWAHQRILGRVERHEIDILLGTQMIAKGLDFPRVTLVGVVNADVGMHLPDFRASERTFQLLSQVAGRAGRSTLAGEVIIQTSVPEHYAIRAAVTHDYEGFATRELEERRSPRYPPHVRLVNVVLSSPDQRRAAEAATQAADWLRRRLGSRAQAEGRGVDLVGPAPAPIERLHGRWRWHFLLRAANPGLLGDAAAALAFEYDALPEEVRLAIDRDPVALL